MEIGSATMLQLIRITEDINKQHYKIQLNVSRLSPCVADSAVGVWMCAWMGECEAILQRALSGHWLVKCCRSAVHLPLTISVIGPLDLRENRDLPRRRADVWQRQHTESPVLQPQVPPSTSTVQNGSSRQWQCLSPPDTLLGLLPIIVPVPPILSASENVNLTGMSKPFTYCNPLCSNHP